LNFDDTAGLGELEVVGGFGLAEAHRHLTLVHHLAVMLRMFLLCFLRHGSG